MSEPRSKKGGPGPDLWAVNDEAAELKLDRDFEVAVIEKVRQRLLFKDYLFLFARGFASVLAGFLGLTAQRHAHD